MNLSIEFEKVINAINLNIDLLPGECECWIPGYENKYRCTNFGRILSCNYMNQIGKMKWLKPWTDKDGYLCVCLGRNNVHKVHKLVLITFYRAKEQSDQCRHLNRDIKNNRWWNIVWGSGEQNQFDRIAHGTHQYGEKNPNCILSDDLLKQLITDWETGFYTQQQLGDKYRVSQGTISKYINGERR